MDKSYKLTAKESESLLFKEGFKMIRSKGSHRIYKKGNTRLVIPFHSKKVLHPKIIRQVFNAINKERN